MQARLNLVASWKTFLTSAISTWQEYATLFEQQQREVQEQIRLAQENFVSANAQMEQSQLAAGKIKTIEVKDDEEEMVLGQASSESASAQITNSFKSLSTSLQTLQAQTEAIQTDVMKNAKRPRLEEVEEPDQKMEDMEDVEHPASQKAGPPFT